MNRWPSTKIINQYESFLDTIYWCRLDCVFVRAWVDLLLKKTCFWANKLAISPSKAMMASYYCGLVKVEYQ